MPKASMMFSASIELNPEKAGGWLAIYELTKQQNNGLGGLETITVGKEMSAWKNASAAKRWLKAKVQELTPRKSVKLEAYKQDANQKPTALKGKLEYKA